MGGLLFCASCGGRMTFVSRGSYSYAVCGEWKRSGGKRCRSHCCREEALNRAVRERLQKEISRLEGLVLPDSLEDLQVFQTLLERVELDGEKQAVLFLRVEN